MTGTLKVNTQTMRTASSEFSTCGSSVNNLTQQMLSLIAEIGGAVWSGEAASAYQAKFAGLASDISKMNAMIQEHVDDLNTMATEFERAEAAAQQEASALKSNLI